MSTLVSRVLSQADKIPIIHHASSWLPTAEKKEEMINYDYHTPRYSMAPPSYENVVKEKLENKRFGNTLSTIWKRASFSSSSSAQQDEKTIPTGLIDKKQIEHAATLINVATDMNNSGNQQMAIDLYMMGLDKLVAALPLESDPIVKTSLERKLVELNKRHQLSPVSVDDDEEEEEEKEEEGKSVRTQISNLVINATVLSAVALKKSPIPDVMSHIMNYAVDGIQCMDEKHQIRKRTWDFAASGFAKAVEIDRQYEIHQMVTGVVYTGLAAFVKAGIAYAETPGPKDKEF